FVISGNLVMSAGLNGVASIKLRLSPPRRPERSFKASIHRKATSARRLRFISRSRERKRRSEATLPLRVNHVEDRHCPQTRPGISILERRREQADAPEPARR